MKTVTIPTCANPFVVIVNGIKYTYPAGATVEVPDDVAAVIEQHDEAHNNPEPAPVVPPFAPVPSEDAVEVIDLTKYTQVIQGTTMSHNDAILTLFSQNGGNLTFEDNTAFWADLNTDKPIKFLLDLSLLFENHTFECSANSLLKQDGELFQVDSSFLLALNGGAKVTILFQKSVFNGRVSTIINVLIEQIKST